MGWNFFPDWSFQGRVGVGVPYLPSGEWCGGTGPHLPGQGVGAGQGAGGSPTYLTFVPPCGQTDMKSQNITFPTTWSGMNKYRVNKKWSDTRKQETALHEN